MDMFKNLLGGDDKRSDHEDFVKRFEQGAPWDGISDEEAEERYASMANDLPPEMYEESAHETLEHMTPEQRQEFGQLLEQRAQEQNVSIPGVQGGLSGLTDSRQLAQVMGMMHRQQPGMLGSLLGAGGGRRGGGGMAGMASMAASRMGRNPIEKAALAGIAAMATKKLMNR